MAAFLIAPELIDTLWNVNEPEEPELEEPEEELIDTLWNVNCYKIGLDASGNPGINRYIMECK